MSMLSRFAATEGYRYVNDVFSTWLYTGTAASRTINNGINLSAFGGMVWIKRRDALENHFVFDTNRGTNAEINTNTTDVSATLANSLAAFNNNGFTLNSATGVNTNNGIYTSWTFRKAPRFFDVVSYTGNGQTSAQNIPHSLGIAPGVILLKRISGATSNWFVYHTSLGVNRYLFLNRTDAPTNITFTSWTANAKTFGPPSTSGGADMNVNNANYIAYLFADDNSEDSLIKCGQYTGNGSTTGPVIDLGWEPQWVIIRNGLSISEWNMFDNLRGIATGAVDALLYANQTTVEFNSTNWIDLNSKGFQPRSTNSNVNGNGNTYVYIAIRRPNKPPSIGTEVFNPTVYTGTNVDNRLVNTTIAPDLIWVRQRDNTGLAGMVVGDRLRAQPYLVTGSSAVQVTAADALDAEIISTTEYGNAFSAVNGFWCGNNTVARLNTSTVANNQIAEAFKRAPGFFDVVTYAGTLSNRTVNHNLQVPPELILVKDYSVVNNWAVYPKDATKYMLLTSNAAATTSSTFWNNTAPTATTFTVGIAQEVNDVSNYVAYLFATLPGISKVGTYVGNGGTVNTNGTSQTIDCQFTTGARFVLIKSSSTTGDWYVFDSARGIVAANDPYLLLNVAQAEVTTVDAVDTANSGFVVNQTSGTNLNVTNVTYLYLAIS